MKKEFNLKKHLEEKRMINAPKEEFNVNREPVKLRRGIFIPEVRFGIGKEEKITDEKAKNLLKKIKTNVKALCKWNCKKEVVVYDILTQFGKDDWGYIAMCPKCKMPMEGITIIDKT